LKIFFPDDMTTILVSLILVVNNLTLAYLVFLNGFYTFLLIISSSEIRRYLRRLLYSGYDRIFSDPLTPSVSLLVPVHNEELNVVLAVKNLLHLRYPKYEVIVINDGSTDDTLRELIKAFRLIPVKSLSKHFIPTRPVSAVYYSLDDPSLRVIDKENGGKADTLNAGINFSKYDYFLSVDGDAILEEDALLKIIRPVVEDPSRVVAVGGIVRVANGCRIEKGRVTVPALSRNLLPIFQVIEYLRAFLTGRTGLSTFNGNLIISGAFGLFRKEVAMRVGGYKIDTVGEDMELVTAFHAYLRECHKDYRIVFIGDPVCWTEVPESLKMLSRQRRRWQRGLMEVLSSYKRMLFSPKYGLAGCLAYPFFYFFEGWGVIVEVLGYFVFLVSLILGMGNKDFAVAFFAVSILWGVSLSLLALILEEMSFRRYRKWSELFRLVVACVLENFGYRQLMTFFRFQGTLDYLQGKSGWGEMERKGLDRSMTQ
jgi:cellulose synthase/poly-beta-1,6-N-acetylglucosamine synthase-like glycosyltransferase